jgi:hypothetical protein
VCASHTSINIVLIICIFIKILNCFIDHMIITKKIKMKVQDGLRKF